AGGAVFGGPGGRVRSTPRGEQLRARIATAIDLLEAGLAETQAAARGATGSLRVGFTRTTYLESLSALIRSFEKRHPECELVEREVPMMDPYRDLRASEIAVLWTWLALDAPDLPAGPVLDRQERIVAVASDHPFATRDEISVEELGGQAVSVATGLPRALWEAIIPSATPKGVPIPRT